MHRTLRRMACWSLAVAGLMFGASLTQAETPLDRVLQGENADRGVQTAGGIDDLAFLRRLSVDLIGRIPTDVEIREYLAWAPGQRRERLVEKLLNEPGFTDRWFVFMADLLRVRANSDGSKAWTPWLRRAVADRMPYDVMVRKMITATGQSGQVPEVGYMLGDQGNPMALASSTAQVFMGVRIGCAECHDHPFDVWKREQFYGLAAYYGQVSRSESMVTKSISIVEQHSSRVLWPPEGVDEGTKRKPVEPKFPFALASDDKAPYIQRLQALRQADADHKSGKDTPKSVDDLLAEADPISKVKASEPPPLDVAGDAKNDARKLDVENTKYQLSRSRTALADLVTSPQNRYFSRHFANRVWSELIGRGIVMPLDDFSDTNEPSHPATLDYLADEFVAGGYDLRNLVKVIVLSDAYQRGFLPGDVDPYERKASVEAFAAAATRRMMAESLYDSVLLAGHVVEPKFNAGENLTTVRQLVKIPYKVPRRQAAVTVADALATPTAAPPAKPEGREMIAGVETESALQSAMSDKKMPAEMAGMTGMTAMSPEQMEAEKIGGGATFRIRFVEKWVDQEIDDNPVYERAITMSGPQRPSHFLRVFGQTARDSLGDVRDSSPSMQQTLMMFNGKMTYDAARVGTLETVASLLQPGAEDREAAIRQIYRETLTRDPSADETADALTLLDESATTLDGIADLRWVLLNSNEFRYLP